MTEIIEFGLFPSYVLNYNTLLSEDKFVSCVQACFFQNRSRYMVIINTVMPLTSVSYSNQNISHARYARNKQ